MTVREQYRRDYPQCQNPRCFRPSQQVHEIFRGIWRPDSVEHRELLLAFCRECHDLTPTLGAGEVKFYVQLAWKYLTSLPGDFNLQVVNEVLRKHNDRPGRPRFTMKDLRPYIQRLQRELWEQR